MRNLEMYGVETLNTQEMVEIDGGSWIGDVLRWTGDKLKKAWQWLKKINKRAGENGGRIPLN